MVNIIGGDLGFLKIAAVGEWGRPAHPTLTASFANIEANEAVDIDSPDENRQLVHNLNRICSSPLFGVAVRGSFDAALTRAG